MQISPLLLFTIGFILVIIYWILSQFISPNSGNGSDSPISHPSSLNIVPSAELKLPNSSILNLVPSGELKPPVEYPCICRLNRRETKKCKPRRRKYKIN